MKIQHIFTAGSILIFVITACNFPTAEQAPPPSDVQTAAALTVEAELLHQMASATIQAPLLPVSSTPTFAPTGTITPTYSVPILSVREQTNCRTGPGQDYEVIFTYLPNKKLEIIGRFDPGNFWLVKSSESQTGECWLWGEYVDLSGSYWVVASVTPPPTKTIPPPNAPVVSWDYFCNYASNQINVDLKWSDAANNETGYRVIRNGGLVTQLPANSTTFSETIVLVAGDTTSYQVEVYNSTDATRSSPVSFAC